MSSGTVDGPPDIELFDGAAQVLTAVRQHGCQSRVEIIEHTGMSRMVVAQRVQQLVNLNVLREEGLAHSSGGRRPRRLTFAPPGHLLVADVGWTSIDAAVTDLTGQVVAHASEPADVTEGPELILSRVEELWDGLLEDGVSEPGYRWGVGIGLPAPVEFDTGRTVSPAYMHVWDGYPVRERLTQRFGAPVWVDKDVNIMMLGEWREGAARGHGNALFAKAGTGLGVAMISEGRMHRGAQGCAGDIGNLQRLALGQGQPGSPVPGQPPRSLAADLITQQARQLADSGSSRWLAKAVGEGEPLTTRLVAEAAAHGDGASIDLLRWAATLVGTILASIVSLLNPSLVIVGGGMSNAGDFFMAAIREVVYGQSIPLATRDLQIVKAELGSNAGVVGAAAMVLDQLFNEDNLKDTVARRLTA